MHSSLQRFSFCVLGLVLGAAFSAAADADVAERAYQQKDYATAFKESMRLAEQGNAEAQLLLGRMYMKGQGVLQDPDQAAKWFRASAEQGNANAQFLLGAMNMLPQKNVGEGLKWMRLSAEQGNQDAQYLLGKAYLQGLQGLPPDPVQAEMWLWLAAKDNLAFYKGELRGAEGQMRADQVARGKALATAWKRKTGLKPDQEAKPDGKPKS